MAYTPETRFSVRLKRFSIVIHRWLGVALCVLFMLWFPSGIVMMYWDYPGVRAADRLERSPALEPQAVKLSPAEAYKVLDWQKLPDQALLNTFDSRPVYRFRQGRDEGIVYADTGDLQQQSDPKLIERVASHWSSQPANAATVEENTEEDQWTVAQSFRALRPMKKYSWADGQQVYVSEKTGEVVQYTTTGSRVGAYFGAIPHWLYFTPLRKNQPAWSKFVIWTSGIGTGASLLGIVIGLWMYSPGKRYRYADAPSSIPYRGQKRWHTILGLIFGSGAATWAFSGMMSMGPFSSSGGGRGRNQNGGVPVALRGGRLPFKAFAEKHPREALKQLIGLDVKQLEFTNFAGEPIYLATLQGGATRVVPMEGAILEGFDPLRVMDVVSRATQPQGLAELRLVHDYDVYYLDRHGEKPLPVILAQLKDSEQTRYYIDPKSARVVGNYSSRNWMSRWLYHGLHSLDFPWLYKHRPLWDIVVILFMTGGTALCVTSLVLSWRVIHKKFDAFLTGPSSRSNEVSADDVQVGI